MKRLSFSSKVIMPFLVAALVVLPGCQGLDWLKEKLGLSKKTEKVTPVPVEKAAAGKAKPACLEKHRVTDGSEVLVSFGDVPIVTKKSLEQQKKELIDSNPQYKQAIEQMAMMGVDFDKQLAEALALRVVYEAWCEENKIPESEEYKKELAQAEKSIRDMLNTKAFSQALKVTVTDKEVKEFYDQNKDQIPGVRSSAGGVKAMGVPFESEQTAQEFLAKAKAANGDLKKAAQQANIAEDKIKDWGLVRPDSYGINQVIKDKVVSLKTFPTTEIVKINDKDVWVVSATSKEEAKYKPFDQVKNDLKNMVEQQKLQKAFEEKTRELTEKYLTFNPAVFKKSEAAEGMPEAMPIMKEEPTKPTKEKKAATNNKKAPVKTPAAKA